MGENMQKWDKVVTIRTEVHGLSVVLVNIEEKRIFASDGAFACWGHADEDGKFWSNSNDITTNYLEVAGQKALERLGIKVTVDKPFPQDRKIEIVKVEDCTPTLIEELRKKYNWA